MSPTVSDDAIDNMMYTGASLIWGAMVVPLSRPGWALLMKREWVFHSATVLGSAMIIGGVFALYERQKYAAQRRPWRSC